VKILVAWIGPRVGGKSGAGLLHHRDLLAAVGPPLIHRGEESWINRFSRWFYFAEIPLVVVLLLAIGRRVQEYGMTENRYFVVLLGLWLGL